MIGTVALIPSIPGKNFSHVGLMAGNKSLEAVKEMYLLVSQGVISRNYDNS
jgi:hypothetical protein